ncbi:MAG: hypothetical protein ABR533_06700 [Desulfonatronovibrio sp.]
MISIIKKLMAATSFKHAAAGQAGSIYFSIKNTSIWYAWIQASRVPSQAYIFLPLLMGQSMAFAQGKFTWTVFFICHLYGIFVQLFIVFANDVADEETDRLNSTFTVFQAAPGSWLMISCPSKVCQLQHLSALCCVCLQGCCSRGFLQDGGHWH